MENPHLKRTEDGIDNGVAGLKATAMPSPPAGLVQQMIAAEAPRKVRSAAWVWKSAAALGGLGLAAFFLMPQQSSAAVTLDRLVGAYQRSQVFYRLTPYWIEGKKRTPKIFIGYVKGDKWHYVQSDYEQASDGVRVTTYLPNEGRALWWEKTAAKDDARSIFVGADLSWWKSPERTGVTVEHNVPWNGMRVDRYKVTTTSKDWGPLYSTLYADPEKGRPLYEEAVHASGNGYAMKWDYLSTSEEGLLEIKMKSGTKFEDVTAQKASEQQKRGDEETQKASNGG